jgi:hypothetical protein
MKYLLVKIGNQESANLEEGLAQPLLLDSEETLDEKSEDNDDSVDYEKSHEPATSFVSAYKLLTPSVKVCFFFCLSTTLLFFPEPKHIKIKHITLRCIYVHNFDNVRK